MGKPMSSAGFVVNQFSTIQSPLGAGVGFEKGRANELMATIRAMCKDARPLTEAAALAIDEALRNAVRPVLEQSAERKAAVAARKALAECEGTLTKLRRQAQEAEAQRASAHQAEDVGGTLLAIDAKLDALQREILKQQRGAEHLRTRARAAEAQAEQFLGHAVAGELQKLRIGLDRELEAERLQAVAELSLAVAPILDRLALTMGKIEALHAASAGANLARELAI
jgi:hypothetical protein